MNRERIQASDNPTPVADGNYNIIFITTDQERYFPEYPDEANFAARELLSELGCTFEKHYICANMSTSSRSVIYTGTHVTENLMRDNVESPWQFPLDKNRETVGDMMRSCGYYTAYKGKFHMGTQGIFDVDTAGQEQKQNALEDYGFSDWNALGDLAGSPRQGYSYDEFIQGEATGWLREKGILLNEERTPFFLAVNFVNPHDIMYFDAMSPSTSQSDGASFPVLPSPGYTPYVQTYDSAGLPASIDDSPCAPGHVPAHEEYLKTWDKKVGAIENSEDAWKKFRDYYCNCIQDNDDSLLTFLQEVANLGLLDNTIIVFTSDHGEMEGDHGLRGKGGFMYERNTHVPLVIYHPEHEGGNRVAQVTSHIDLASTFVDMTGVSQEKKAEVTSNIHGTSILPLLSDANTAVRDGALFAFEMYSMLDSNMSCMLGEGGRVESVQIDQTKRGFVRGLTTTRYKFARYFAPAKYNTPTTLDGLFADNDVELYDLESDPDELVNLASEENRAQHLDLIEALNNQLTALIADEIGEDSGMPLDEILGHAKTHDAQVGN